MYRLLAALMAVALVGGCNMLLELSGRTQAGGSGGGSGTPEGAQLKRFESERELADFLAGEIQVRNSRMGGREGFAEFEDFASPPNSVAADGAAGPAPSAPDADAGGVSQEAATADGNFSETTIQEEGVDEADVVKTDGTYLYIISGSTLRIVRAAPAESLAAVSELELSGFGRDLYLREGKVIALTETFGGYIFNGAVAIAEPAIAESAIAEQAIAVVDVVDVRIEDFEHAPAEFNDFIEPVFQRPTTMVTVIDVTVPESPAILSATEFDGTATSSRMIDGVLHLVLANFQSYYFDVLPMLGRPELDVTNVDVETLLPEFTRIDAAGEESGGPIVTWQELYRPEEPDGFGMVTVISMDVDAGSEFAAVGVVAEPGLIYASLNALYLTDTSYDFNGIQRETTDIYKLAFDGVGATPVAAGVVPGRILNQYSMGEYEGNLRVATTVGPTFGRFGSQSPSKNNVYVLEESAGELRLIGSVENIAPRETIRACRFVGSRGYVVTFEQIDPLFTLDLSVPTDPRIMGELKVPGFSTYIVPMDENHLLAVGQYIPEQGQFFGNWGVQLSIFDVTNFAEPVLQESVVIGAQTGASSEALFNPKAFTYFASRGLVALPVSIYEDFVFFDDGPDIATDADLVADTDAAFLPFPRGGFDGLFVFDVSVDEGFTELGRISTRFDGYYGGSFTRGVFIGDDVYAVTDQGVRASPVSDVNSVSFEITLGVPNIVFLDEPRPPEIGVDPMFVE